MKIKLELADRKAKVKRVVLKADTVIGRSTECDLRIASTEVSRQHCKICMGEDGVTVRDLGSSNGTYINGYELEPDTDYEIAPDSELALGGIKFFVRFVEPATRAMVNDGMGSTVDLKPPINEPLDDELISSDADEPIEDPPAATEVTAPPEDVAEASVAEATDDEEDVEFTSYSDSAVLEHDNSETPAEEEHSEATESLDDEIVETVDLEVQEVTSEEAFPEVAIEEDIVDVEVDAVAEPEEIAAELEEVEIEEEIVDVEAEPSEDSEELAEVEVEEDFSEDLPEAYMEDDEENDPFAHLDADEDEASEEELQAVDEEEPPPPPPMAKVVTPDSEAPDQEPKEALPAIPVADVAEVVEPSEDDVAAFLNDVDEADSEGDADLGDFFKQFD